MVPGKARTFFRPQVRLRRIEDLKKASTKPGAKRYRLWMSTNLFNPNPHLYHENFPTKYNRAIKMVVDQCPVKQHLVTPPSVTVTTNFDVLADV